MNTLIKFLSENSGWLKDVATIIFTATGTVIAILSYRRAKSTIFQPKRTEVIKIQTQVLTEFLTLFTTNGNSLDNSIDYISLYRYNIDLALRDYDLVDNSRILEKQEEYEKEIGGWFQFLENDIYKFILVEGSIQEYNDILFKNNGERQKKYIDEAKRGQIKIHRIFYAKKYSQFHKKLRDLSNNPSLPKDIRNVANQIGSNMTMNLHYDLRNILKKLVSDTFKAYEDTESNNYEILSERFRYETLWRIFEQERKHHDEDYELLKNKIREHLMIDRKW